MACGCNKTTNGVAPAKSFAVIVEGEDETVKGTEIEARALVRRKERQGKTAKWEVRSA